MSWRELHRTGDCWDGCPFCHEDDTRDAAERADQEVADDDE